MHEDPERQHPGDDDARRDDEPVAGHPTNDEPTAEQPRTGQIPAAGDVRYGDEQLAADAGPQPDADAGPGSATAASPAGGRPAAAGEPRGDEGRRVAGAAAASGAGPEGESPPERRSPEPRSPVRQFGPWVGAAAIAIAAVGGFSLARATADDSGGDSSPGFEDGRGGRFPGPGGGDGDGGFPGGRGGGPGGGFPGGHHGDVDGRAFLFGTVASVDDDSFEIEGPDGDTVTATVSDDTEITEITDDESREASLGDIEDGDEIVATGEQADDGGDFEATSVHFGDAEAFEHGPGHGPMRPGDMSGQPRHDDDRRDQESDQDSSAS